MRPKPGVDGLFTTRDYRSASSTHHVRRGRLAWPPVLHRGLSGNDGAGNLFDDVLARPRLEGSGELVGLGSGTRAIAQARDEQEVEHWDREVERDAERSGHVGHRHR